MPNPAEFTSALLQMADCIDAGTELPKFEDVRLRRLAQRITTGIVIEELRNQHCAPPIDLAEVDVELLV